LHVLIELVQAGGGVAPWLGLDLVLEEPHAEHMTTIQVLHLTRGKHSVKTVFRIRIRFIRIRIQVKGNFKKILGNLFFNQKRRYLPTCILFNKERFYGRIFLNKMKIMKN